MSFFRIYIPSLCKVREKIPFFIFTFPLNPPLTKGDFEGAIPNLYVLSEKHPLLVSS